MRTARTLDARKAVRRAGLYPAQARPDQLLRLDSLPIEDLADAIVHEKVSSLLLRRLREDRPALVDQLARQRVFVDARTRIEALVRHKAEVLDIVDKEARTLGVDVWAVKGLAMQPTYPDPDVRDLGDLDLMVSGVDEAIRLTARLMDAGYDFHSGEWPWLKRTDSGLIYGQFSLKHGLPQQNPAIDLHFGGYSIRHCGLHPLPPGDSGSGLSYYRTQQNLPLIVGNAAGDHDITTKDLNDLAIAIGDPALDWSRTLAELEAVRLLRFFRCLIDELDTTPFRPIYRDSVLPGLLAGVRPEAPAPLPSWPRQRRWAVTVLHAFALGARHSYRRAATTSLTAARYYWGTRSLEPRRGRRASRLPRLTSWTCLRLVPAAAFRHRPSGADAAPPSRFLPVDGPALDLSAEVAAIRSPVGDIVRTPLGDFVAGVYSYPRIG